MCKERKRPDVKFKPYRRPDRTGWSRVEYPRSRRLARPLMEELNMVAANGPAAVSIYLNTEKQHSNVFGVRGKSHHQGLARTHKLSDGSLYYFLTHSVFTDWPHQDPRQGQIMRFRYEGLTDGEHVVQMKAVAALEQLLEFPDESHPCDLEFLPDVNPGQNDSGYLFVAMSDKHSTDIFSWQLGGDFQFIGSLPDGGGLVALDRLDDEYYCLWTGGMCYRARYDKLFPSSLPGRLDTTAFEKLPGAFIPAAFNGSACQVKLVQDSDGQWWLLGFRSKEPDKERTEDYVDAYRFDMATFSIGDAQPPVHIFLPSGDTSFASTGTCHVDTNGRLLISSSYRWSEDEGPNGSGYVSRVDEVPSS